MAGAACLGSRCWRQYPGQAGVEGRLHQTHTPSIAHFTVHTPRVSDFDHNNIYYSTSTDMNIIKVHVVMEII